MKCAKCHKKIVGREVKVGENRENLRTICEGCRKLWIEIFTKKVDVIKDRKLQGEVWITEYHKFIGIFDKETVTFT